MCWHDKRERNSLLSDREIKFFRAGNLWNTHSNYCWGGIITKWIFPYLLSCTVCKDFDYIDMSVMASTELSCKLEMFSLRERIGTERGFNGKENALQKVSSFVLAYREHIINGQWERERELGQDVSQKKGNKKSFVLSSTSNESTLRASRVPHGASLSLSSSHNGAEQ